MNTLVNNLKKTSLVGAIVVACIFAVMSNFVFNSTASLVISSDLAGNMNNVFDVSQLVMYIVYKLKVAKTLNRFDLPFVLACVVSIVC